LRFANPHDVLAEAVSANPAGIDMRIEAVVTQGGGWASGRSNPNGGPGTIERQKPLIQPYFPEIMTCHNGTINLLLDCPLQVRLPDIVTPPLDWHSAAFPDGEKFGITEIELGFGGKSYKAWLYTAEHSPHRFNNKIAEVLTGKLDGVALGIRCAIHVKRVSKILVI
jgi:hypothetical protein